MIGRNIGWLWAKSAAVCEGKGLVVATRRVRFVIRALAIYGAVTPLIDAPPADSLGRLMAHRPETVGAVVWPYQCAAWDARTRIARICEHYAVIESIGGPIDFPVDGQLTLLDLGEIHEGLQVVVDQPKYRMREGQLTINLFLHRTRMYSLTFSLFRPAGARAALIGGIQSLAVEEGVLEQIRELSKAAHGMHPRHLLIEVFRVLCAILGITEILAVSNQFRHHHSRFFGVAAEKKLTTDYDPIWQDRGGERVDQMFYRLPVTSLQRDLDAPLKKRNMYRRRYEMLDTLRAQMLANYSRLSTLNNNRHSELIMQPVQPAAAAEQSLRQAVQAESTDRHSVVR